MKLKTFKAPTMHQALAQVKSHLGANAVIVHTRTTKRGGLLGIGARMVVEITARKSESGTSQHRGRGHQRMQRIYSTGTPHNTSETPASDYGSSFDRLANDRKLEASQSFRRDRMPEVPKKPIPPQQDAKLGAEIGELRVLVESLVKEQRQLHAPQMPEQLFDMYLDLIQREVADEIAREMMTQVQRDMTGDQIMSVDLVRQKLIQVMDEMISTTGPISTNIDGKARVVVLIGPTGVGKTTSIAKIAANLKLRQNKKVGLITIDTYRIGAVDQLRMYAQIIDVPLKVVLTPHELTEAVLLMQDMDVILIDTAGRSQNDELKLQELKTFLNAASPDEVHLVLSSTATHSHMLSAAERFKSLGVDRLILTKLDEAISFGVVLSVLRKVDASVSYITTGQDVPDDIEVAGGRRLARMLLGLSGSENEFGQKRDGYLV
ncbi:MAG: flagellar biosynthesis protein FlhF [Phycisphaerae bacterium]|nr:flagellar biosynthesis protein FlhF [Phycisphaerae bacterium]